EDSGLGDILRGFAGALATNASDCYRRKAGIARPGHLRVPSCWEKRRSLCLLQIPDDGPRREPSSKKAESSEPTARPLLQDCQRSPGHAARPISSQIQ